jgi:hypothetical protein
MAGEGLWMGGRRTVINYQHLQNADHVRRANDSTLAISVPSMSCVSFPDRRTGSACASSSSPISVPF